MTPMSGLDLLREIRSNDRLHSMPFLMVTGSADLAKVRAAKDAGVSGYVVKPFTTETLNKKLNELLDRDKS